MNSESSPEDVKWLTEVQNGQLLGRGGKPLPDGMKRRLIALGWIEEKLGGLQITPEGRKVLRK